MAKVFLSPSNQYDNRYAYGNTTEGVQCGKIAEACKIALIRNGIDVMLMHDESMQEKCQASNAFGADLHVPIHTNAFNGKVSGTRMFCYSANGEGMKACKAIFNVLAPITPGTSENIKVDTSLYEVRTPNAPTAYIEVDFHDNPTSAKWIVENTTLIGETIAKGICNYFGIAYKAGSSASTPTEKPASSELYRVRKTWDDASSQIGAFAVLDNAIRACKDGYKVFDKNGVVVYPKQPVVAEKKSVDELAKEVLAGKWGNGSERRNRLESAGYDYNAVQNRVNEIAEGSKPALKSIAEVAKEVLEGKWGNGAERKSKLEKAGYNYDEVQNYVNKLVSAPTKKSVDEIAREVIAGKWGNGLSRRLKLKKAGYNPSEVQKRVNQLLG